MMLKLYIVIVREMRILVIPFRIKRKLIYAFGITIFLSFAIRSIYFLFNCCLQVAESKRLKALVTMAGPDIICVGAGKESQEVLKVLCRRHGFVVSFNTVFIYYLLRFHVARGAENRKRGDVHLPDTNCPRRCCRQCTIR